MKSAFTMIELIFVIVILGILAGFAMVKINATRADAYNITQVQNFKTMINDFNTYYLTKGEFAKDKNNAINLRAMTNVALADPTVQLIKSSNGSKCYLVYIGFSPYTKQYELATSPAANPSKFPSTCKKLAETFKHYNIDLDDNEALKELLISHKKN